MDAKSSIRSRIKTRQPSPHGGSTDAALHFPAVADAYGIGLAETFKKTEIFKKTSCAAGLKPGGRDTAKDMFEIAGIPLLNADVGPVNVKLTDAERAKRKTKWMRARPTIRQVRRGNTPARSGRQWMVPLSIWAWRTRNSVMRTSERIIFALILGATPLAAPAFAFDGAPANQDTAIPVVSAQPGATAALKRAVPPSVTDTSLTSLQYAAEGGHPVAQWKLGRMYADGDGVAQSDLLAFDYFSRIANAHAEDSPSAPQAAIVANAFVALGRYYLNGIPNSKIKSDPERAREMFSYAASYFGNADAQYDLARLYLKSAGSSRDDFRYGARWLGLAAQKGQHQAQAMLGQMLFNGEQLPRQAARGLMWLTLARDSATPDEAWIKDSYTKAISKASEDDRAMALQMLEHWVQGRKD
jgi:TPR repeat protein